MSTETPEPNGEEQSDRTRESVRDTLLLEAENREEVDALRLSKEVKALLAAAERRVIPRSQRRKWQRHLWNTIEGQAGALEAATAFVLSFPAVADGRRPIPEFAGFLDILLDQDGGFAICFFGGLGLLALFLLVTLVAAGS